MIILYIQKIIYDKEKEIILTKEKSKGVSLKDDLTIDADEFEYDLKASSYLHRIWCATR